MQSSPRLQPPSFIHYSLEFFTELRVRWDVIRSLIYLGEATTAAGDSSEARRIFLKTLSMVVEMRAIPMALEALVGLAYHRTADNIVNRYRQQVGQEEIAPG